MCQISPEHLCDSGQYRHRRNDTTLPDPCARHFGDVNPTVPVVGRELFFKSGLPVQHHSQQRRRSFLSTYRIGYQETLAISRGPV